ncbi:hypothetical protein K0M31_007839 [Melipona bicolor]|uniref:Uncharacterized protein n=1 Tax=Melipona bicolor TaxID=60889 RepID=A0AA40GC50_9HYME|nr:hypothetical protein K0M31_007839 [Melipona bicolor]
MRKKPKDIDSFCWKTGSSTVERNQGEGSSYEGLGLGNQGMRVRTNSGGDWETLFFCRATRASGSGIEMLHPKAFSVRLSSKLSLVFEVDARTRTMQHDRITNVKAAYRRLLTKLQEASSVEEEAENTYFELLTLLNQRKSVFRFREISQGWPSVLLKFKSHLPRESNKGALSSSS